MCYSASPPAPDLNNSKMNIADADQGGLGLPDRDYYLKDDANSVDLRKQYVAHVQKMLELLGEPAARPPPTPRPSCAWKRPWPKAHWTAFRAAIPTRSITSSPPRTFVAQPGHRLDEIFPRHRRAAIHGLERLRSEFFRSVDATIAQTSLDDLKAYLRWHLVHAEAHFLAKPFVDENFHFFTANPDGRQGDSAPLEALRRGRRRRSGFCAGPEVRGLTFGSEAKGAHAQDRRGNREGAGTTTSSRFPG